MPQHRTLRAALLIVLIWALVACTQSDSDPKPTVQPHASVTLLSVTPQLYLAGFFGATTQNYFADANLDTQLIFTNSTLEQTDTDVLAQVVNGQAQFGVAGADHILRARQQGTPVVAIASIYQRDPTAVIALAAKNITTPPNLNGKKVLVWSYEDMFRLFALKTGLDMSTITLVYPPEGSISQGSTMFITGQVDAMIANGTDTEVLLAASGIDYDIIYFNDYGVAMYPNVLFTTEAMIQNQPDVVQRFVSAFIRGMQYAEANPTAMGTYFLDTYADQLLPQQRTSGPEVMQAIIPLIHPPDSEPGVMMPEIWQFVYDAMREANLLDELDITQAYSRQFVNNYYKND